MTDLAQMECVRPRKGDPALPAAEVPAWSERLGGEWRVVDGHHLEKTFRFKDFQQALDFTHRVGAVAEGMDHHPEIRLAWGRVTVTIWTHTVDGLSPCDFIFAARVEALG
jgi:4a-hydroxytetrahydrobiopterin dehydratase